MRIGELARLSGLPTSRIRFYETSGLLDSMRQSNGYREFSPEAPLLLEIIRRAQEAGFSLEEIRHLLPPAGLAEWPKEQLLSRLRAKVADIEALQQRLADSKSALLTIIARVEAKPDDVDCAANAAQVLADLTRQS